MPDLRLIDINALPRYMATPQGGDGYMLVVPNACLVDAPRVDAELVRHGRWCDEKWDEHPHMHNWRCSICHYSGGVNPIGPNYKYCPNCGVKMDGGEPDA